MKKLLMLLVLLPVGLLSGCASTYPLPPRVESQKVSVATLFCATFPEAIPTALPQLPKKPTSKDESVQLAFAKESAKVHAMREEILTKENRTLWGVINKLKETCLSILEELKNASSTGEKIKEGSP